MQPTKNLNIMANKSFLVFEEVPNPKGKTKRFRVKNTSGDVLGWIHWRSGWRKYVYGTGQSVTEYDVVCLTEISNFLTNLMEERKNASILFEPYNER